MLPHNTAGTFHVGRLFGIDVYLHWMWFLLIVFEMQGLRGYDSRLWNGIEILSIFGIVLMHEFGHALACRSVGGQADRIVLWLLGGVAFVQPPPRPGAVLWSIAAGPLVNVALIPVTLLGYSWVVGLHQPGWDNLEHYAWSMCLINAALLVFNLLPIYPLDGGQILQALLWFVMGRGRSLRVVAGVGLVVGAIGAVAAAVYAQPYLMILAFFIAWQSYNGFRAARMIAEVEDARVSWSPDRSPSVPEGFDRSYRKS